jgi:iron complex outermembrane receptor protein
MAAKLKSEFLTAVAYGALSGGCLLGASPAWAGQEDAGSTHVQSGLQDIVVTARKQAESLQDVPTAITALNAEMLQDLQINSFQDVGKTVPNVLIQKQAGSPTAPQFNIRGISAGSIDFQIDSGVALYVDGVYMGRPGNSGFDLADLERLEVLRGP